MFDGGLVQVLLGEKPSRDVITEAPLAICELTGTQKPLKNRPRLLVFTQVFE